MPAELVQVKTHGAGGTIVLNRLDKRHALSREMLRQISQALSDLHQEKKVRAVILTATGDVFCAGMDLYEIHDTAQLDDPHPQWLDDARLYRQVMEQMLQFPKPIIAGLNGPVLGGGTGLVLAADVVVAGASAKFGVPAPYRGMVAGMVAPLLAFRIGHGQAAHLMLTAKTIDAEEAFRMHLFHEIVPDDLIWARGNELATELSKTAQEAIAMTKRIINETIGERLTTLLAAGAAADATAKTTEAATEGVQAFIEKRDPSWP